MNFLQSSYFFDYESDEIQQLISEYKHSKLSDKEKAIALYNLIRDGWKYDPYSISLLDENYRASIIAQRNTGNCVDKSIK